MNRTFILVSIVLMSQTAFATTMSNEEALDFDYFKNNWNVIGLKDYVHGCRITPDDELLLSGKTPIQIRFGVDATPLARKHGKRALFGWMPIMQVTTTDGAVKYDFTYWATPLPSVRDWEKAFYWPTEGENFLCWLQVKVTNTSTDESKLAKVALSPTANPNIPKDFVEQQAEPNMDKEHNRSYTWSWTLKPGQCVEQAARYTYFPIDDPTIYDNESPQRWLDRTIDFWKTTITKETTHIEVPCPKATEAYLASHVCQLIANDHGELRGGEHFYDVFYPRDGAYQVMEFEEAGLIEPSRKAMDYFLKTQNIAGRFHGGNNQVNQFDANGQVTWTLWQFYKISGDRAFLQQVYPNMMRAMQWTMQARRKASADSPFAGLLPPGPADGECLWDGKHHIVGYDLWNLRGMLCTADAARILGKKADEKELRAEIKDYRRAIEAAHKQTGLDHFPPSWEGRGTHWGNTETLWPTELFSRDDPRVDASIRYVREEFAGGFIEGTIQWKGGGDTQAIHPYMGAYTVMADMIRGRHEQVVEDFYWYLLHTTAAHAFPEGIYYQNRMAWNHTIPHVTGACNYAIMLRHMLVHEAGDELHLLSAVPDWWLDQGKTIRVESAPTHFGRMDLFVHGTEKGIEVRLGRPVRNPPKRIILHLPESRPLVNSIEGVDVVVRSNQKKRWDFPTVVSAYQ